LLVAAFSGSGSEFGFKFGSNGPEFDLTCGSEPSVDEPDVFAKSSFSMSITVYLQVPKPAIPAQRLGRIHLQAKLSVNYVKFGT
jgi:hypothetical protein